MKTLFITCLTLLILTGTSLGSLSDTGNADRKPSEAELILKILTRKGIITEQEYAEALREISQEKAERKEWKKHVDKHITHMEEARPQIIDGLSIAAGITGIVQGTDGNDRNDPPKEDVMDGTISVDLEFSFDLAKHGEAFLLIEAGAGEGLQDDEVRSYWGVNDDAGDSDSRLEVTEAWYEHSFLNNRLVLTAGKLDLTNYFDTNEVANDETIQFLATGFVNNIAAEFPDNSPGVRLTVTPAEFLAVSLGWQDGNGDFEDLFEGPFLIAEAHMKPVWKGLQGNYRIYGWINAQDHVELNDASRDNEDGSGFGISIDQEITEELTLFGRLGIQDRHIYEINIAWSGGFSLRGSLWNRDDDHFGFAYGQALLSDDYEDVLRADSISPADEGHLEIYYSLAINEHITLTPDIQIVTNALGDDDFETVLVGGVRGQVTF